MLVHWPFRVWWYLYIPPALLWNSCISPTQCIYVFRMIFTVIDDYFPKQLKWAGHYVRDASLFSMRYGMDLCYLDWAGFSVRYNLNFCLLFILYCVLCEVWTQILFLIYIGLCFLWDTNWIFIYYLGYIYKLQMLKPMSDDECWRVDC